MTSNIFRNIDGCIRTVLPKRPLVPSQPKTLSPKYPPTSSPLPFLQKTSPFFSTSYQKPNPNLFSLPPLILHPSLAHSAKRYVYCSSNQSLSQHFRIRILSDPTQGLWYYYYYQHRSLFLLKTVSLFFFNFPF